MTAKLKPCPFCGSEVKVGKSVIGEPFISCVFCVVDMTQGSQRSLVRRWNRRPESPASPVDSASKEKT